MITTADVHARAHEHQADGVQVQIHTADVNVFVHLTPEAATKLANALTDAVDQLDGREMRQCTWRSASADDGYCPCVKPAGHEPPHDCAHGLDHNATGRT